MDVTAQPLKGEAMPPQRSPCDDFTSTVTPLDPDTPLSPTQNPYPLSLQLLVLIGPPCATVANGTRNGRSKGERRKEGRRTGEQQEGGHAKGQLLVRGFYWECGREGAGVGVCVKDHRLRF